MKNKNVKSEPVNFLDFSIPTFQIKNAADDADNAHVYIYGVIGGWDIDVKDMVSHLVAITAKNIHLHIHSPGGSITDGWAIFNTIQSLKNKVIFSYNEGACFSMAVTLLQAAQSRHMAADALMMIHKPLFNNASGNATELRQSAELLDKIESVLVNRFLEKTKMKKEEIVAALAATTFYTAQEAFEKGFIDVIDEPLQAAASFDVNSVFKDPEILSRYEAITNKSKVANLTNSKGGSKMNLEKIKTEYPELYAQIFGLGKAAGKVEGVAEGKALGMVEGKAAGLAEGKGVNVTDAVKAAVALETERIKAIENLSMPGSENIIAENKFKAEMTSDKVAALIVAKQQADIKGALNGLNADGKTLAEQTAAIKNGAPASKAVSVADLAEEDAMVKKAAENFNKTRR